VKEPLVAANQTARRGPRRTTALVALLLALAALGLPLGALASPAPFGSLALASGGRLLVPRGFSLNLLDAGTGVEQTVHTAPGLVLSAAWSPDGGRIAYAQLSKQPGDRYGGADLFLLEGGQSRLALPRSGPDQTLTNPVWTPDGGALIYQLAGGAGEGSNVEQADLGSGERRTLEREAGSPALSPDGATLAFVRYGPSDVLMTRPLGGGPAAELLPADLFLGLSSPRFSPEGRQIAFLGIGGPSAQRPSAGPTGRAWLRLGPAAVEAHGLPYDPWIVNADGSGLRLVARLAEDDPALTWSPDGSTLAILGGGGLWLAPLDGRAPSMLAHGNYGTLDWRP
jgi:Tol biopolymer transport system component